MRVVAAGDALIAPAITRRLIERVRPPARAAASARRGSPGARHSSPTASARCSSCVAKGLSNAEIASELFVSHATVKTHVSRLLMKLDARDRAQLVMIAYETGVASPGSH